MRKAFQLISKASRSAVALLLALAILGPQDSSAKGKGKGSGKGPDGTYCHRGHCHDRHERHKRHHGRIGHHNHRHGTRASNWGNWGSAACGRGQGSCAAGSGSGLRSLASALGAAASDLTSSSKQLGEMQKEIVQESMNEEPGRDNPDARKFDESTQSGTSRMSDFTDASDPIVKEQIEQYNDIGKTRDELDAEAKKYEEQQKEMDALADKSEKNADNLESETGKVAGNQLGAGGRGKPESTIANGSDADKLANSINGNQGIGSDISSGLSNNLPEGIEKENAKYPDGRKESALGSAKLEGAPAASVAAKGVTLRESLREKIRSSSGGSSSRDFDDTAGPEESATSPAVFGADTSSGSAKVEKVEHPTVDSANAEESLTTFDKHLGNGKIAIAGSETDASVKAMLRELGVEKDIARQPASQQNSEIGSKDGPSLFERCRATYKRCAKNGCVTQAGKVREGG